MIRSIRELKDLASKEHRYKRETYISTDVQSFDPFEYEDLQRRKKRKINFFLLIGIVRTDNAPQEFRYRHFYMEYPNFNSIRRIKQRIINLESYKGYWVDV